MLSRGNQKQVDRARAELPTNPGYYARTLAAIQRCEGSRQQAAVEAAIAADNTAHLFNRSNGCLTAIEGI